MPVSDHDRGGPDLCFPIEFFVRGTPVASSNTGSSKKGWIEFLRAAYAGILPEGHWSTLDPVYVTILYFPDGAMRGDVDNIVKWIVDAMKPTIYLDDGQVERVIVQTFEPGRSFSVTNPSSVLTEAMETTRPVVYIRVDDEASAEEVWSW